MTTSPSDKVEVEQLARYYMEAAQELRAAALDVGGVVADAADAAAKRFKDRARQLVGPDALQPIATSSGDWAAILKPRPSG